MWEIAFAEDDRGIPLGKTRFEFFRKKHPDAVALLFSRLQSVATALNSGIPVAEILRRGFIHQEGGGVFAISPGQPPLRLYCCLEGRARKVVILTLGDKRQQGADIMNARNWARDVLGG